MRTYHLVCWTFPILSTLIVFLTDMIETKGHICRINAYHSDVQLASYWILVIAFILPLIVIEGYVVYVYWYLKTTLGGVMDGTIEQLKW